MRPQASGRHLGRGVAGVKDRRRDARRRRRCFALTRARQGDYQVPAERPAAIHRPGYSECDPMSNPFLWLISTLIWTYIYILIAAAVMSWLVAFNVVNYHNPTVRMIGNFLYQVTEPALRPLRAILPSLGGIDISPVILIIGLMFLERLIYWVYLALFH
jgi:YggT family protein